MYRTCTRTLYVTVPNDKRRTVSAAVAASAEFMPDSLFKILLPRANKILPHLFPEVQNWKQVS